MNFFDHQDQARQRTTQLMVLFFGAIAGMIAALYLVTILGLRFWGDGSSNWWRPGILGIISVAMLGMIGGGSLTKLMQLRRGGVAVAESLGGQLVVPQTDNSHEQRLLNVVAEMALASGTPIPAVYRLPNEPGINAFAAGHSPDDAVIGVTQGCLDHLSRDQLQGIIAHEFSHILNGDMRLNLRLIGVLQGLLWIHLLGRWLLRGSSRQRRRGRRNGNGNLPGALVGLAITAIGGIGWLGGRLIKCAISRQREFLADASAVQFTRNPDGLAGALRQIATLEAGAILHTVRAEEASHMFFGEAMTLNWMGQWLATHPPLPERLRRLTKEQAMPEMPEGLPSPQEAQTASLQAAPFRPACQVQATEPPTSPSPETALRFLSTVGNPRASQLTKAQAFLQSLPPELTIAVRSPAGAMAIVYALLIDEDPEAQAHQLQLFKQARTLADPQQVAHLAQLLHAMDTRQHLPLLDLAIPVLRTMTPHQCAAFFRHIKALVRADGRLSISEYVLQLIVQKRLRPYFQAPGEQPPTITSLNAVWRDCMVVLTLLAYSGHGLSQEALSALRAGVSRLPGVTQQRLPQALPAVRLYDLGHSLKRLEATAPKLKQAIVDAAAHTVLSDNQVTPQEAEVLRAVVITLDCPIPPFLESALVSPLPARG